MLLKSEEFRRRDPTKHSHDAVVVDTKDPEQLGRVRVKIPGVYETAKIEDLPWVMPRQPATGSSVHAPPELHSRVTVEFEGGDIYSPVYVGSRASRDSKLDYWASNPVPEAPNDELPYSVPPTEADLVMGQSWTSASGAQNYFRFDRNQGKLELFLGDSGTMIHVDRGGNVQIATDGNTDIKTAKLHIEASDEIFIKTSGNLNFEVGGSMHSKVAGDSSTNVSGNKALQVSGNIGMRAGGNFGMNASGAATMHGSQTRVNEGTAPPMSESGGSGVGAASAAGPFDLDAELSNQLPAILGTVQSLGTFIQTLPETIEGMAQAELDRVQQVGDALSNLLTVGTTLSTAGQFQSVLSPLLNEVANDLGNLASVLPDSKFTNAIKTALSTSANSLNGLGDFTSRLGGFVSGGLQNPRTFITDLLRHHGRVMLMNSKTVAHIQTSISMLQQHETYLQQNADLAAQWVGDLLE